MTRMMKPFIRAIAVALVLALALPAVAAPERWVSPWEWVVGWIETWWAGPDKSGPMSDPHGEPLPSPPAPQSAQIPGQA